MGIMELFQSKKPIFTAFTMSLRHVNLYAYFSDLYFSRMACCGSVSALRKVSFSAMMHSLKFGIHLIEYRIWFILNPALDSWLLSLVLAKFINTNYLKNHWGFWPDLRPIWGRFHRFLVWWNGVQMGIALASHSSPIWTSKWESTPNQMNLDLQ